MLMFLTGLAVAATAPQPDARASDAVAAFSQLCVGMFIGEKADIEPSRFNVTKLDRETAKLVLPDFTGDVWDVSGKSSDLHMLVHYEPNGMCVVQVNAAGETEIRASYTALVLSTAETLKVAPQRQPDRVNDVQSKPATTSMWRLSGKPDIMLAVTTYPEAKFMIQHMMTVSRVK